MRRLFLALLFAASFSSSVFAASDPLPSWNDSVAKKDIVAFVQEVTHVGGDQYVMPEERIAVFDNDGTLWAEQPLYFQMIFAMDRIKQMAPAHPEWKDKEPFKSVLTGGHVSEHDFGVIMAATHAGMTTDAFADSVSQWLATARHPSSHRPYTQMVYQPMLELLSYLRANGFKTYIVSGGGVEFMRVFAEKIYGVPPEQVIGSTGGTDFQKQKDGTQVLMKEAKVETVNDGPGKPESINRVIGRKPILAFGNSDGDQQMLEWTAANKAPHLMGLIHHTDGAREWAYDRKSPIGTLDKALSEATAKHWVVVDMKQDWAVIFPPKSEVAP